MKKYRKCDEIVEILKAMIRERVRSSCYYLPGEVMMAEEIGVSRITLRKAMAQLEAEGMIRRDRVRTEIIEKRDILSQCGKILFIASAHYTTFILPAIERLWMKFAPEVINRGGNVELFAVNHSTPVAEWRRRLAEAEVIFLSAGDSASPAESAALIGKAAETKIVFSLLETIVAPNRIYLDNYIVGRRAAETLLKAGCRNIGAVSFDYEYFHNLIFARRMAGFHDVLEEEGLYRPELVRLIRCPSSARFNPVIGDAYIREARQAIEEVHAAGSDGVFVVSDEEIGLITMNLFRHKMIPRQFKLLSVNGVGDAMRNQPPISCLSHGTHKVVDAAIEQLKRIAERRFVGPVDIAVQPSLYINYTLSEGVLPALAMMDDAVPAAIIG